MSVQTPSKKYASTNLICQAASSRASSVRRNDQGSRIPRPLPFGLVSVDSVSRGRAESASTDSDDSEGTIKTRSAIPVRIQGAEQQRFGPTLRVVSAAERELRGSRSVSFAAFSEARQSGSVFYPRTLRGDTPPRDNQKEGSLRGEGALSTTKEKFVRVPPRSSSLNALSDVAALQASVGGRPLAPGLGHPVVEGNVLQDNFIKTPPPRMNRVLNSVRSVLSLSGSGRRSEIFQLQRKNKESGIPRPDRSATALSAEADLVLERLRSEIERPVARSRRPGLMPSIDQVRVAVNAVGRKLVTANSLELRKQWFRVSLPSLYIQF